MKFKRSCGIFLHPTSLPGRQGIGSLGKAAYQFIDFLYKTKQSLWQICPLGHTGYGDSPYQCFSAFAGNPLLIDLEDLVERGLLAAEDLPIENQFNQKRVDYGAVIKFKYKLYRRAFENFNSSKSSLDFEQFNLFIEQHNYWLGEYAFFMALKDYFNGVAWQRWNDDIKNRCLSAIKRYKTLLAEDIQFYKFLQYIFFEQWVALKEYANRHQIKIIGDIPIFVALDSADAWAHSDIFYFDQDKEPIKVAGVPPDYFSKTGQLWGNPLYNWDYLEERGYDWWIDRFTLSLEFFDILRLDHFRGFEAYWAIPETAKTAVEGEWELGPGLSLFKSVENELGDLPIIAEDLGVITEDVEELREELGYPGMKVLHFAFESDEENQYLPENHDEDAVVYTGTHDNDTTKGWFAKNNLKTQKKILKYLDVKANNIHWGLIKAAWDSKASMAIVPLQDILGLGSESRMNKPGTAAGNWQWRYEEKMLTEEVAENLLTITLKSNREQ